MSSLYLGILIRGREGFVAPPTRKYSTKRAHSTPDV